MNVYRRTVLKCAMGWSLWLRHSETSAMVLKQMREDTTTRNGELERILQRQGSKFTTMLAVAIFLSIAALAAVGVIGYLLINPPVR